MDAAAVQSVSFPTPGLYRLRLAMHTRRTKNKGTAYLTYAYNPLRAWLADAEGNTNEIAWTEYPRAIASDTLYLACSTNFVEHAFTFLVPEAGVYTLGIQGVAGASGYTPVNSATMDSNALVDGVWIGKVEALETPDLSKKLAVSVEAGARLRLDFAGTNRVGSVTLGDRSYSGVIDARRAPAFIEGPGALMVLNTGSIISIR